MPRPNRGYQLGFYTPKGYKDRQWVIFWYERSQKRERATGLCDSGQLAEAEEARAAFVADRERPSGPATPDRLKVAQALHYYGSEYAPTCMDAVRIGDAIKALLPFWADSTVAAVKGETCRAYARSRTRKVGKKIVPIAPGTIRRELGVLSAACGYCHEEGYLTAVPGMWLPDPTPARDRWLTRPEAAALLRAAKGQPKSRAHLPTFIMIGLYTGAREEAIRTLQWIPNTTGGHIDLDRGIINFNPIGRRVTNKRRAIIPIPPQLMIHLRQVRKRTKQYPVEYQGKPVGKLRTSFGTACREADVGRIAAIHNRGLPEDQHIAPAGLRGVVRHTLRHTACTWFMHRGVSIWDAAGWVGMDPETFNRKYAHHHPDYMGEALASFTKSPQQSPQQRV